MANGFTVELWVEYAVGMGAFFLRFFTTWLTRGFQSFALDEFFCGLGVVSATFFLTNFIYDADSSYQILFTCDAGLTYIYGNSRSTKGHGRLS